MCEENQNQNNKGGQPKVKSESSEIQGKEASVKIAGQNMAERKEKKAPAKEK
jgi:hypothetical protein